MVAVAAFIFGLTLIGIIIVKLRKGMMKKSTMKAVTFQGKEGVDNKIVEMGTVAKW